MKYFSWDVETSIGTTIHGSEPKDPSNDFYSLMWASNPKDVQVLHSVDGFNRTLPCDGNDHPSGALLDCETIVGVNLTFDLSYIYNDPAFQKKLRLGVSIWSCDYVHYLLTAQRHQYPSLVEMQDIYLGVKTKEDRISALYKKGIGADKILKAATRCKRLFALYEKYCIQDVVTPLLIMQKQREIAERKGMLPYIELMQEFLLSLIIMQNTGIHLDIPACEETLKNFRLKAITLLEKAQEIVKPMWDERLPEFNINSPQHKSAMLFGGEIKYIERLQDGFYKNGKEKFKNFENTIHIKGFGLLPSKYSREGKKEGQYSTDADTILKIHRDSDNELAKEYCKLQVEAMNIQKMANTYLQAFLERSIDGVLYPNFNTTQTITSRLSSSKPNLQNVPAHGEMGGVIESLMIAPEGWKCVSIDFSQLECYVRAWLCDDPNLIADTIAGKDWHCSWLAYSTGKTEDEIKALCKSDPIWAEKRSKAKPMTFQEAYGAGTKSLAEITGFSVEETQQMLDNFYLEYPRIKEYRQEVLEAVNNSSRCITKKMMSNKAHKNHVWRHGVAMLPIFEPFSAKPAYIEGFDQQVGYYQAPTGGLVSFYSMGRYDRQGKIKNGFMSTQIANYPIQSTANTVLAVTMVQIKDVVNTNDRVRMILTIHDSIRLYIRKGEEFDKDVKMVYNCFTNANKVIEQRLGCKVPFAFAADIKVGKSFGELNSYDLDSMGNDKF
jgi:DNA polymerase I-like protein with 3'-5' exonuclease and polymerase domains